MGSQLDKLDKNLNSFLVGAAELKGRMDGRDPAMIQV